MSEGEKSAPGMPDPVEALQRTLRLRLDDRDRALAALTHKSYANEHRDQQLSDNERLEFLGDAVVDLVVSHRLMERFPSKREGDLSKMRAAVVDEASLAAMGRSLGLGALLRLGRGEEMTGGREKPSLLADAMEAVIGAVYLEHGIGLAAELVDRFLEDAFARAVAGTLDRDYKTQLQEAVQARLRASPRYRVVGEEGPDHSKIFDVAVEVQGEVLGRGSGRSKKDAEQEAARAALAALVAFRPTPHPAEPGPGAEPGPPPKRPTRRRAAKAARPARTAARVGSRRRPRAKPSPGARRRRGRRPAR